MVSKLGSVSSVVLDDGKEADARLELLAASRQEPSTTNWALPMTMYHFTVPVYRVPQTKHSCMYVPETIALPKQAALPSGSLPPTILNHSFGSWKPLSQILQLTPTDVVWVGEPD